MKLKVVCLNVWIGGLLFDELVTYLQQEKADVYLLQEVYSDNDGTLSPQFRTFQALQEKLAAPYSHFAPAFIEDVDGREIVQGNAIFSTYPLHEISVTHFDVPFGKRIDERAYYHLSPRSLQHVIVELPNEQLHVLNTQGIWGEDGEDNERRLEMSRHILAEISTHQPLLLAGDFNLKPATQTIANIESTLTNVFKDELTTSFNLKRKDVEKYPGFASAVVDMMFVTPDIKVIQKNVPDVDVSDHLPLVCELEIN